MKGREAPSGSAGNELLEPCRVQSIACVQQSVHSVCAQILLLSHYTLPCFVMYQMSRELSFWLLSLSKQKCWCLTRLPESVHTPEFIHLGKLTVDSVFVCFFFVYWFTNCYKYFLARIHLFVDFRLAKLPSRLQSVLAIHSYISLRTI